MIKMICICVRDKTQKSWKIKQLIQVKSLKLWFELDERVTWIKMIKYENSLFDSFELCDSSQTITCFESHNQKWFSKEFV